MILMHVLGNKLKHVIFYFLNVSHFLKNDLSHILILCMIENLFNFFYI
jgi:hypothetical protein